MKDSKTEKKTRVLSLESDFRKIKKGKSGGVETGLICKSTHAPYEQFMIKDMKVDSIINEYIGSRIAKHFVGESAPDVSLVKDKNGLVYTASKFIPNFITTKEFSSRYPDFSIESETCNMYGCAITKSGTLEPIQEMHTVDFVIQFVLHADAHHENRGIRIVDKTFYAAIIDFNFSLSPAGNPWFDEFSTSDSYVQGYVRNPVGYASKHLNPESVFNGLSKINSITEKQIDNLLDSSFKELRQLYPDEPETLDEKHTQIKTNLLERKKVFFAEKTVFELILNPENDKLAAILATALNMPEEYNYRVSDKAMEKLKSASPKAFEKINQLKNNPKLLNEAILQQLTDLEQKGEHVWNEDNRLFLQLAANYALSNGNHALLIRLLLNNQELSSTMLREVIYRGSKDTLDMLLPEVKDQKLIADALKHAVIWKRKAPVDQLLSSIEDPSLLTEPFRRTIYQRYDRTLYDTLLPKVTDQNLLGEALSYFMKSHDNYNINRLLSMITDSSALEKPIRCAIDQTNWEMIYKLWPKLDNQERLNAFNLASITDNFLVVNELLPKVTLDQASLINARDNVLLAGGDSELVHKIQSRINFNKQPAKFLNEDAIIGCILLIVLWTISRSIKRFSSSLIMPLFSGKTSPANSPEQTSSSNDKDIANQFKNTVKKIKNEKNETDHENQSDTTQKKIR